jgi:uncharacterized membrane protein (UPF0127 family)
VIVRNQEQDSSLGAAIAVAGTSTSRAKGLLGRDSLADGEGLLFKNCSSLHTFFMRFPIDIIFTDKNGRVLKVAKAVGPFRFVAAPLRSHFAIELPVGAITDSSTRVGDHLMFVEEEMAIELEMAA